MANISSFRLMQLERAEKDLKDRIERDAIAPFANDFVNTLGMILALTPFEKWPQIAKDALGHVGNKAPTAYALYKERLPKS